MDILNGIAIALSKNLKILEPQKHVLIFNLLSHYVKLTQMATYYKIFNVLDRLSQSSLETFVWNLLSRK